MSKKRRGPFGKKASRLRATAAATVGETTTAAFLRNNSLGRQSWKKAADGNYIPNNAPENVMQELARNTRNQTAHWDQSTRLRDRPVSFISGGLIEPSKELQPETVCLPSNIIATRPDETKMERSKTTTAPTPKLLVSVEATDVLPSRVQDEPADDSDSSGEVILFKGRGEHRNKQPGSASNTLVQAASKSKPPHGSSRNDTTSDGDDDSNAAMDDYISNLLLDDMQETIHQSNINTRELGGSDNDIVLEQPEQAGEHTMGAYTDANTFKFDLTLSTTDEQLEEDSDDDVWGLAETMDDEHLAMLFAKQEELGMGSGELLLLNANSMKKPPKRKANHSSAHGKKTHHDFIKGLTSTGSSYPSAEAVANAFEQLDVTGWKGSRSDLDFNLSDSELEAQLKNSWQKDRQRKKEKKRAREELREKGLLGKNSRPNDPRVKYPNGIHMDDIKTELHDFLLGSENSIIFPPMNAQARKVIHEIAYSFNIASKSIGSGDQRRPTLSRTKATLIYNEADFQDTFAHVRRRYLPRLDGNRDNFSGAGRRGNAGAAGAATVKHGEIVGGSAPEIGQTNKGRTMLEKMGWCRGMALGAMDNKGMIQPIEHVVIRSKAGLG